MKLNSKEVLFGGILLISFVLASVFFYGYQMLSTPNLQVEKKDTYLYIPKEASFQTVLDSLTERKILHDPVSFAFLSKLLKYQQNVRPGRYLIHKNMNNLAAVRTLRSGMQVPVQVTFNNIRLQKDFTAKIASYLNFSQSELDSLLDQPAYVQQFGFDTTNVLSMFIPNTYEVYWTTSADQFVKKMHQEYEKFWNDPRRKRAQRLELKPQEVAVLASIVQAETNKAAEKPRIAGVYLNRLRKEMTLDADPTLVYALGDFGIRRVLDRHKQIDSPYNTYQNLGLPPGPINMPSPESIDAVLKYEDHDFLYFCAKEDFSGYHNFAKTYNEHLKNARLLHAALNQRGIR